MDDLGRRGRVTGGSFKSSARRRWLIAAGVAGLWLALAVASRSLVASLLLVLLLAGFAGVCYVALRSLGINRDHPFIRFAATRPWRGGKDVFRLATNRMSDVFIITPKGSLLAPSSVDMRMNPDDVGSLAEVIDLDLAGELAQEAYEVAIREKSARVLGSERVDVQVVADPQIPAGRYVVRQRAQLGSEVLVRAGIRRSLGGREAEAAPTKITDEATMAEQDVNPILQLITGDAVAQTRMSGARAGRGQVAELLLPESPTVSRVHARFTCAGGQWAITCLGRNGLMLNGAPLRGTQPVHHGDLIRWGRRPDALTSRVELI